MDLHHHGGCHVLPAALDVDPGKEEKDEGRECGADVEFLDHGLVVAWLLRGRLLMRGRLSDPGFLG